MKNLVEIDIVNIDGTTKGKTVININQIVQVEDLSNSGIKLSRIHFSNSLFIDVKMNGEETMNYLNKDDSKYRD